MSNLNSNKPMDNVGTPGGWKGELQRILDEHADKRVNGKVASHRTKAIVCSTLFAEFNILHDLGYRTMPRNFGNKHMTVLVKNWYYNRKLANKTMATHMTQFRKFADWLGKDGMVRNLAYYLPEVDPKTLEVEFAASEGKSWTGKGLDVELMIELADAVDIRLGCILRLQYAFGYRIKECLHCDPWASDQLYSMAIFSGQGKGNRPRNIPIDSPGQREIIAYIKTVVKKGEKVAWCDKDGAAYDFRVNYRRYYTLMEKLGYTKAILGISGHGLRAEYAEDIALRLGFIPPTLGGTENQMPKEDLVIIQKKVTEALGHGDPDKVASYYGGLKMMKANSTRLRNAAAKKTNS